MNFVVRGKSCLQVQFAERKTGNLESWWMQKVKQGGSNIALCTHGGNAQQFGLKEGGGGRQSG